MVNIHMHFDHNFFTLFDMIKSKQNSFLIFKIVLAAWRPWRRSDIKWAVNFYNPRHSWILLHPWWFWWWFWWFSNGWIWHWPDCFDRDRWWCCWRSQIWGLSTLLRLRGGCKEIKKCEFNSDQIASLSVSTSPTFKYNCNPLILKNMNNMHTWSKNSYWISWAFI